MRGTTMKHFVILDLILLSGLLARGAEIAIEDTDGSLGATRAPVAVVVKPSRSQERAGYDGRLVAREINPPVPNASPSPAQILQPGEGRKPATLCWQIPPGPGGKRRFRLEAVREERDPVMLAEWDGNSGQFEILDDEQPALRYNYAPIEPGSLITNIAPASRIYAVTRSDYLHPLHGLDGETLTQDWSVDHPHHRGIYWAWPEVDWRGRRGDLHALQHVFARPTDKCITTGGPVFAQVEAENVWKWETGESLVQEKAVIRVYHATGDDRLIDLEFRFTALNDPVLLARRGTDKYGGLNMRLAKVAEQVIVFHTDPTDATPRRAWAELNGKFGGATRPCGLVVLQHSGNPDYPGDWVKFPEINWFQPTFPASGTRFELKPGRPLVLRFRLWLHRGGPAEEAACAAQWQAYHAKSAPKLLSQD